MQKKTEEKTVEIEILNVICANRIAHKRLFREKTKRDVEKKEWIISKLVAIRQGLLVSLIPTRSSSLSNTSERFFRLHPSG